MKKLWSWFFLDNQKRVVVGQWPNWPLWIWLVCTLIGPFAVENFVMGVSLLGKFSLLYWSYLELTRGVNGFRKVLGLMVGVNVLWGIISLLF